MIVLKLVVGFITPLHFAFSFKHCKMDESHCKIVNFCNLEFFFMCLFISQLSKVVKV